MFKFIHAIRHNLPICSFCVILQMIMFTDGLTTPYIPLEKLNYIDLHDNKNFEYYPLPVVNISYDYFYRFILSARFITRLQVSDPDDPDYGGMREGEHLLNIIQSDNTQESIWIWSRYQELTQDLIFSQNIDAAWKYIIKNPAYLEEGGSGPEGYYRIYNCGWGLQAVMKYLETTGDSTYISYGDSAASYVIHNKLDFNQTNPLFALVQGWAIGSLYQYGKFRGKAEFKDWAVIIGGELKKWIETEPEVKLKQEVWAMSSGVLVWGIVNSYFMKNRNELAQWCEQYGTYLEKYVESGEWQNAFNGWYSLGHFALWKSTGNMEYYKNANFLTDNLLIQDTEDDGGIPAKETDPYYFDQSWVTNYMGFSGFERFFPDMDISSVIENSNIVVGDTLKMKMTIVNNSSFPLHGEVKGELTFPNGHKYHGNPVDLFSIWLQPDHFKILTIQKKVPNYIPKGIYEMDLKINSGSGLGNVPGKTWMSVEISK